jgi:hypothetical protein
MVIFLVVGGRPISIHGGGGDGSSNRRRAWRRNLLLLLPPLLKLRACIDSSLWLVFFGLA